MSPQKQNTEPAGDDDVHGGQLSVGLVTTLAKAEIDAQVATARQFPRLKPDQLTRKITELATIDEQTAGECMYALPRGNKPIRGPSIRFAEIVAQCWGNNRTSATTIEIDRVNKLVIAEGMFHDLETNHATKATV
ncbi:MAG TPA: hypothetical protein VKE42_10155, partial [Candidatus Cybelea sp.]|nr:hypothetical protein [Candidatus Cybelea sp.]